MRFLEPDKQAKRPTTIYSVWTVYTSTCVKDDRFTVFGSYYVIINNTTKKVHSKHKLRDKANELCNDLNKWRQHYNGTDA